MVSYKKIVFIVLGLAVTFSLSVGIFIGSYWHHPITKYIQSLLHKTPNDIRYCPSTAMVKMNQSNPNSFNTEEMIWTIDFQGWKAPDKIGFMQAIINKENNLVCYYQWPNPQDQGKKLWMTVQLSPLVTQKIKPFGTYWNKVKEDMTLCSAGINSCAFEID